MKFASIWGTNNGALRHCRRCGHKQFGFIREKLCADDYVVFCDSGLKHLEQLQAKPSLIVGDFDSHENPHLDVETIVLPCEKDDTDTVFAVKEAIKRGFEDFLLIGVVGQDLTTPSAMCLSCCTSILLARRAICCEN